VWFIPQAFFSAARRQDTVVAIVHPPIAMIGRRSFKAQQEV
jgi:hypothetical protein